MDDTRLQQFMGALQSPFYSPTQALAGAAGAFSGAGGDVLAGMQQANQRALDPRTPSVPQWQIPAPPPNLSDKINQAMAAANQHRIDLAIKAAEGSPTDQAKKQQAIMSTLAALKRARP